MVEGWAPGGMEGSWNGRRVLLVDDNPVNLELAAAALRPLQCQVERVLSGAEALDFVHGRPVDLVVLDAMMPGLDGFEVCRRIKMAPATRFVPVIMVTALDQKADRIRGIEAGADDFLTKPFHPEELRVRAHSLLRLKSSIDQLEAVEDVLRVIASTVEAKDLYTEQHTERVAHYAVQIGAGLGLSPLELDTLRRASFLHDVGKVAVPETILCKPGPLTAEEWEILKQHPVQGEKICRPLRSAAPLLGAIRHHHERVDGKGYPDGLAGEEIPLFARIIAAADAFDAMTSDRPYRKGMSWQEAREILIANAGTQWDAQVVAIFAEWIGRQLTGRGTSDPPDSVWLA